MNKINMIKASKIDAMKRRDTKKKDVLNYLLGAIYNFEIAQKREATDAEIDGIILKQIKQVKEVIDLTPPDRIYNIMMSKQELDILSEFAPKMMSEAEIRHEVYCVKEILGISTPTGKDKGHIMKELMPRVRGKSDNKLVDKVVDQFINRR